MKGAHVDSVQDIEERYSTGVYAKRGVTIVRGQGTRLWDAEGTEYIDCASGMGVASVGHAHPRVAEALAQQARTLITCPELFYNDRRAALLEKLVAVTPPGLDRVFLCNSGTEAIEGALKFARASTGKNGVVAATRGYHGRTLGALAATWDPRHREIAGPLPDDGHAHSVRMVQRRRQALYVQRRRPNVDVHGRAQAHQGLPADLIVHARTATNQPRFRPALEADDRHRRHRLDQRRRQNGQQGQRHLRRLTLDGQAQAGR